MVAKEEYEKYKHLKENKIFNELQDIENPIYSSFINNNNNRFDLKEENSEDFKYIKNNK